MTATAVSPTSQRPRHDVTLTDGSTTVGFILTDANGNPNPRAISDSPQQRTAVKTSSGDSKYSDLVPPWGTWVQDDWSGGRGIRWADDDKSRFYRSAGVDTSKSGEVILSPRPKLASTLPWNKYTDYLTAAIDLSTDTERTNTAGPWFYMAQKWVVPTGMTDVRKITIPVKSLGAAGTITMTLRTDNAGAPDATVSGGTATFTFPTGYTLSDEIYITFTFAAAVTVTPGSTYWIQVTGTDSIVIWQVIYNATSANPPYYSLRGNNGSTWAQDSPIPFIAVGTATHDTGILLEYKGAMYYITKPTGTFAAKMYLNGDRGAADSNTGALTTLVDATKSWTVNGWAGCIVRITQGPGSEEERPWRYISSNTATALTVSEAWTITHTTSTEYVIIDTDYWQEIEDFSISAGPVVDAIATDKFIYLAWGHASPVMRYEAYNNAGTWADRNNAESPGGTALYAHKLETITRGDITYLYAATNRHDMATDFDGWSVWRYEVPKHWGELIGERKALIASTDEPWDSDYITNVTQSTSLGATKIAIEAALSVDTTNGTTVAMENLPEPVDITQATYVGMYILSSTAVTANKIQVVMYDQPDMAKEVSPTYVCHASAPGASATFTDMPNAYDGSSASAHTLATFADGERMYIVSDRKFNVVAFDFGATVNNNAATMAASYFNGSDFTTLTITDGTASGGATFAVDGSISFTPPDDWEPCTVNDQTGYVIILDPSADLDVNILINEIDVQRAGQVTATVDVALVANQWQWINATISPTEETAPDATNIQCVAIKIFEDNAAQNIYLRGGLWAMAERKPIDLPNERINNMIGYSGNQSGLENLWVFTDRSIYELQSENNEEVVELPITELKQFAGSLNGVAACVNDVYLWFNLGNKIERYYLRNLDDIGPDKDEGMISAFEDGFPSSMISYPGRVFLVTSTKNKNVSVDTRAIFSTILQHRGGGWHALHKSPGGSTIGAVAFQAVPDRSYGWLFYQQDTLIFRKRISVSPYDNPIQEFNNTGILETGWIHCGLMDVNKTFGNAKIFCDLESSDCKIYVNYKMDDDATWSGAGYIIQTNAPTGVIPINATGKRIKLKLSLENDINVLTATTYDTPRLYAILLEYFAVVPTKYNYGWTSVLKEDFMSIDLLGDNELVLGYTSRAETAYAQLKTWADGGTKLTMNSRYSVYDNKTVILNAPASQPILIDSDAQREEILISVSAFDL